MMYIVSQKPVMESRSQRSSQLLPAALVPVPPVQASKRSVQ